MSYRGMRLARWIWLTTLAFLLIVGLEHISSAQSSQGVQLSLTDGSGDGIGKLTVNLQILILFTLLSVAPALFIMTTSFVRIIVVLSFLRTALAVQQPPSQVMSAMALFLTFFIMSPTWQSLYDKALVPYQEEKITTEEALVAAKEPIKKFMLLYVRETELKFFMDVSPTPVKVDRPEDLPLHVLMPAFMLSELKTAFQMGLLIILPFLVIDMAVASILMSLGMFMLPPPIVALPIKLMIFVVVDGWTLLMNALVTSFRV